MIYGEVKMKSKEKIDSYLNIITDLFVVNDRILRGCKQFIINS